MQIAEPPHGVELWTIQRACERLDVSKRTVYDWIASGRVDYVRTPSGPIRLISTTCYQTPRKNGREA